VTRLLGLGQLTDARDKLRTAGALIDAVRVRFLNAGYAQGARTLHGVAARLADEIQAIERAIAAKP
jgi:hypothetical protein